MSRQNQKPHFVITPDEISGPPTAADAAEICGLYDLSNQGLHAFVRMGFRLIAVKSRLPHGGYMPWLREHMGNRSHRHMHRARHIAEAIALRLEWDSQIGHNVSHLTELPPEVCALIDGKSGRSLLAELRPPLSPEAEKVEAACAVECEKLWDASPEKRDDWEPRVLSEELTYHRALTGLLGNQISSGATKQAERHNELMEQAADKLKKHIIHFETLPPLAQASVVGYLTKMAAAMPPACREAMAQVWKGGQA
jgi:hypothetical protein